VVSAMEALGFNTISVLEEGEWCAVVASLN